MRATLRLRTWTTLGGDHRARCGADGGNLQLTLHGLAGLERAGDDVRISRTVRANETIGVILESAAESPPRPVSVEEVWQLFEGTARFWRGWLAKSTYRGRWREMVGRSAMTLKLMTYAPTGALVAAPTTALPEQPAGERNWDYRFTWVRDASYSVGALLALGFSEEAFAFLTWLRDRIEEHVGTSSGPLKIMYRVDGSSDLIEESLDHLEGYQASRPVRIGNGAADQLQLDIYGEAMFALRQAGGRSAPDWTSGLEGHRTHHRLVGRQLGPARRRHLGNAWRSAGLHVRARNVVGCARRRDAAGAQNSDDLPILSAGPRRATRSTNRSWSGAGTPTARRLSSTTAPTLWTRPF